MEGAEMGQVTFPAFSVVTVKRSNGGFLCVTVFSLLRTKPESKGLLPPSLGFLLFFKAML